MSIDTDIKNDTNIVHDLSVELQGQIVALVKGEANDTGIDVNNEFFKDNCTLSESFDRMSITCKGVQQQELEDVDGGIMSDIRVSKIDKGDSYEYRAFLRNTMIDAASEAEADNSLIEGMDMNAILGYSFSWRVEMPGTIVSEKTNADSVDGSSAEFISSWDDTRETFEVVSLERKSRGIFGACNK